MYNFLQISNNNGLVSHFVNLQIVVPEATIQGSRSGEHHVDVGSVIDLICVIDKVSQTLNIIDVSMIVICLFCT